MVSIVESKSPIASKLALVCALAMSAAAFAGDGAPIGQEPTYRTGELETLTSADADALARIPGLIEMGEGVNVFLDRAYAAILAGEVPHQHMLSNPFTTVSEIFGRALREVKDLKGTGELGYYGDRLITVLAESRHKADRNANLIRQMVVEPKPYVSSVDRRGLVALARLGRETAASFSS